MTYPHDPLIRVWLDGKAVQYRAIDSDLWLDIEPAATARKLPHFYADGSTEYRLKPVTVRYRVALVEPVGTIATVSVSTLEGERQVAAAKGFIRWLTDWIEVQV